MPEGRRQPRANPHLLPAAQPPPTQASGPRRPRGARSRSARREPRASSPAPRSVTPCPAESRVPISGRAAGRTTGAGTRAPPTAWATPGALASGEALQTSTRLPMSKNQRGRTLSHRPHERQPRLPPSGTSVSPRRGLLCPELPMRRGRMGGWAGDGGRTPQDTCSHLPAGQPGCFHTEPNSRAGLCHWLGGTPSSRNGAGERARRPGLGVSVSPHGDHARGQVQPCLWASVPHDKGG